MNWAEQKYRRSAAQGDRQDAWLSAVTRPIVIELGAGTTLPSVRHFRQHVIHHFGGQLVRINPDEWKAPMRLDVGLRASAADGLESITKLLGAKRDALVPGDSDGRR